jgi:hypothetical protein
VVAGHLKSSEGFVEAHKSLKATAMKLIEIWSGQAERARAKIVDVEAALEDLTSLRRLSYGEGHAARLARRWGDETESLSGAHACGTQR